MVVSFKFLKKKKLYFIEILERRLDSVLYRSCFTKSFRESRLFINHGHVLVNGKTIFKSNYILKKGDTVVYESTVYPGVTRNVCIPQLLPKKKNLNENVRLFIR